MLSCFYRCVETIVKKLGEGETITYLWYSSFCVCAHVLASVAYVFNIIIISLVKSSLKEAKDRLCFNQ